jgi:hypothetical protein
VIEASHTQRTGERLHVPARWMKACGLGDKDALLPIVRVIDLPLGWIGVDVIREDGRPWYVIAGLHGAKFVPGEAPS